MRKNLFFSAAAAAMILASCSNELDGNIPNPEADGSVAYLSIQVAAKSTRASGENAGDENKLNTFYLITFDAIGNLVVNPGNKCFIELSYTNTTLLEPQKISGASKNLVVIANPGLELRKAIVGLYAGSTFATFNKAIAGVDPTEMLDSNDGYTMITAGDETGKNADDKILNPFVTIGNKIKVVDEKLSDADAQEKAKDDRLTVKLERLATKLVVGTISTVAAPDNAKVTLNNWTVDGFNTTFYPFAEKTLFGGHTSDLSGYKLNFYTRDPNFTSDPILGYTTGLAYATVNATTYEPELPFGYVWKAVDAKAYTIENTMAAADQKIGSATRIIMKATYFPNGFNAGDDWFSWAGTDYKTLDDLQKAYKEANATTEMKNACDRFLARVKTVNAAITTNDFTALRQVELNNVPNGGQVVKEGSTPVINWYQKGLCYYSYEIRHNNDAVAGTMAPAKYGVVRNNWYNLTLKSVKGPGTPWYPEAVKPGPGDPDPKDPIDTKEGYLGVDVKIDPWLLWNTDMEDID